jgi:hypothetical protein
MDLVFQCPLGANCEKRLLVSSCLSVCSSVRMEQLGSHWTDSYGIWYLSTFRKSTDKIQVSLKSENNNLYSTLRPMHIYDNISFSSSSNDKYFRVVEKIETYFMFSNFFFKLWILWDNVEKYCRAGNTTDKNYGACAVHAGYVSLQTQIKLCNTYCFSTATVFARTRLSVTLYVHCLSCFHTYKSHSRISI